MKPYYMTPKGDFSLYKGDCREVVPRLSSCLFDVVFADCWGDVRCFVLVGNSASGVF